MTLSSVGSVRFKVYALLLLVNTCILALSAHINNFQNFFYRADVFPFALSVVTMVFVFTMICMDIKFKNTVTARPPFELGWLVVFGTLWLASNAFSTNRWKYVTPAICKTIPADAQYAPYRTWCHELQALRALVWVEWIMFLCTFVYLLRWTITQRNSGRSDVWSTAFSRFSVHSSTQMLHHDTANSEFLQWETFPQPLPKSPQARNQEVVQNSFNEASQRQYDQYMEPQYQVSEPRYTQTSESQYIQPLDPRYTQPLDTHYTQSSPGPHAVEVPYMQQQQGQYIPPSQAQFTHFPQQYFSGPEHTL